ncbi:hypothetical protein ABW19_dt0200906 [Dactylella cylindrospora]|nr:hypothetical protein ABW19_dt0200906 [Dactylella cylindrospora]
MRIIMIHSCFRKINWFRCPYWLGLSKYQSVIGTEGAIFSVTRINPPHPFSFSNHRSNWATQGEPYGYCCWQSGSHFLVTATVYYYLLCILNFSLCCRKVEGEQSGKH